MKLNLAKSIARALLAAVVCAMMALTLTACASESAEDIIRNDLTEELEAIKNLDQEILDELLASMGDLGLEEYGITSEDLCRAWLDGFDYSIDSVVVDGDSAVATVTISCRSLIDGMYAWYYDVLDDESIYSMSEEELNAYIGSALFEALSNASIETNTVDLPYVLNGDTWYEDDGFDEAITYAFFGTAL